MSKSSLVKAQAPFTMVLNDLLNSAELSLSAKGLSNRAVKHLPLGG